MVQEAQCKVQTQPVAAVTIIRDSHVALHWAG
jgi:hypothetical protein